MSFLTLHKLYLLIFSLHVPKSSLLLFHLPYVSQPSPHLLLFLLQPLSLLRSGIQIIAAAAAVFIRSVCSGWADIKGRVCSEMDTNRDRSFRPLIEGILGKNWKWLWEKEEIIEQKWSRRSAWVDLQFVLVKDAVLRKSWSDAEEFQRKMPEAFVLLHSWGEVCWMMNYLFLSFKQVWSFKLFKNLDFLIKRHHFLHPHVAH